MSSNAAASNREADLSVLRARARKWAQVPEHGTERDEVREVVCFRLGTRRYALDARYVLATRWLRELTPVPGTPPAFLGITPRQGGVLPVVALDVLFGGSGHGVRDLHRVLIVGREQPEIGLASGKEIEMLQIRVETLYPAQGGDGLSGRIVAGTTEDGLTLLDGAALLADERLFHRSPRALRAPQERPEGGE